MRRSICWIAPSRTGLATAKYICFDGTSGHTYDVRGRTRPRGNLQPKRRPIPCTIHPTRIFPLQHVDARAWPGRCSDIAEQLEFFRALPASSGRSEIDRHDSKRPPAMSAIITSTMRRQRRHRLLGRRRRAWRRWTAGRIATPIRSMIMSPSIPPPAPSRRRVCFGLADI